MLRITRYREQHLSYLFQALENSKQYFSLQHDHFLQSHVIENEVEKLRIFKSHAGTAKKKQVVESKYLRCSHMNLNLILKK